MIENSNKNIKFDQQKFKRKNETSKKKDSAAI